MPQSTVVVLAALLYSSTAGRLPAQDSQSLAGQVKRQYDRFQDKTTFSVEQDLPEAAAVDTVVIHSAKLIVEHSCKGEVERCQGDPVGVSFFFINRMWLFQNAGITFLIDGVRVPMTNVLHNGSVLNAYQMMEIVSAIIPSVTFQKMAAARAVEVQIGSTEFMLSDKSVAAFKTISTTIKTNPVPKGSVPRKSPLQFH